MKPTPPLVMNQLLEAISPQLISLRHKCQITGYVNVPSKIVASKKPNIASVSDIHFGHRKNKTQDIANNFYKAFPDNEETAQLDYLFIAGDFFDSLLTIDRDDIGVICQLIGYVIQLCEKHQIALRLLKGTPSHEWNQLRLFLYIADRMECNVDLLYFDGLAIEHSEKFNIDILYVPDELNPTTEKTLEEVKLLMAQHRLTTVHYAVMHGQFDYQLPPIVKAPKHDSAAYLKLVTEFIFIGHVHTYSTYERIIAQGSFDRLAHGEEGSKGHIRVIYRGDVPTITFKKNKTAKTFKTLDCTGMDVEAILPFIAESVKSLRPDSYIRITAERSNAIFSNFDFLLREFPDFYFDKHPVSEVKDFEATNIVPEAEIYVPIMITKENIVGMVMERLKTQAIEDKLQATCQQLLIGCL